MPWGNTESPKKRKQPGTLGTGLARWPEITAGGSGLKPMGGGNAGKLG